MCQAIERKQAVIYFDFTAGRGSYDDYDEEDEIAAQVERKSREETNSKIQSNGYHTTFNDFSKIQPKQLNKQNFNFIEQQRRHSYSRTPRGRAPGGNNLRQPQHVSNYKACENKRYNTPIKSILASETKINRQNDMQSDTPISFNWCPKRLTKN